MKFILRMIIFFMCLLFLPDPLLADPNSTDGGTPPVPVLKNSSDDSEAGGYVTSQRSSVREERVRKKTEFISTSKPLPSVALPTDWDGFRKTPPMANVKNRGGNDEKYQPDKASQNKASLSGAKKIWADPEQTRGVNQRDKRGNKRAPKGFSSLGRPASVQRHNGGRPDAENEKPTPEISLTRVNIPVPVPKWRVGGDKTHKSEDSRINQGAGLKNDSKPPREGMNKGEEPLIKQVALPIPPPVTVWPQKDIVLAQNKCHQIMNKVDATVKPIKPIRYGACGAAAPLEVSAVGAAGLQKVSISPAATLNCKFTARFAKWVKRELQPLAMKYFDSPVTMVHNIASYSCRHRYNDKSRKISEHALANALDIAGFTLKNGKSISVLKHWPEEGEMSEFLKAVHKSACKNFIVVLGPEANEAHRNHFHFDVGRYKVCN